MDFSFSTIKGRKMLVSIIIPCYNVENYIRECLESVVNQTYHDLEILCINDGSTDETLSILQKYSKRDRRIKLYNQNNKGLSETRNRGIDYASGQYILFVDSDDWLELNTIEVLLDNQIDFDIICFPYIREFKNQSLPKKLGIHGNITASELQRRIVGPIGNEIALIENLDALATIWGKFYKTDKIKSARFVEVFHIGTWEDGLFNLTVLEDCDKILILDTPLYHYRKTNQNSFTNLPKKDFYKKWIYKFSLISELISTKDSIYKNALQNRIAISVLGLILTEINNNNPFSQKVDGIRTILAEKTYHDALKVLDKSSMSVQWKTFYIFAEYKMDLAVFFLARIILFIINKKN